MAKVKGPLLSMEASGTFGGSMRFRSIGGRVEVYRDGAPHSRKRGGPSAAQTIVRSRYRSINEAWRALTEPQRQAWNDQAAATGRVVSGWNLYLAENMRGVTGDAANGLQLLGGEPLLLAGGLGQLLLAEQPE